MKPADLFLAPEPVVPAASDMSGTGGDQAVPDALMANVAPRPVGPRGVPSSRVPRTLYDAAREATGPVVDDPLHHHAGGLQHGGEDGRCGSGAPFRTAALPPATDQDGEVGHPRFAAPVCGADLSVPSYDIGAAQSFVG